MPRGGVDVTQATGNLIPWQFFLKIELPSGTFRYTDYGYNVSANLDGGVQTYLAYPFKVENLSQTSQSPLDVSYVSIGNLDQAWNAKAFGTDAFREMPVSVWLVQFDPADFNNGILTPVGDPQMFVGRTAGADMGQDGWLKVTLNPHRSSWNSLALTVINPNCPYWYMDLDTCQYGPLAAPTGLALSPIGGSLGAGTYFYQVTALGFAGETLGSTQQSITIAGSQGVDLTWNVVPFAKSYNVYGRTTGAGKLKIANTTLLTYNDVTTGSPSGALPSTNTTGLLPSCLRTRTDCAIHENLMHFGGADWMPDIDISLQWGAETLRLTTNPLGPDPNVTPLVPPGVLGSPRNPPIRPGGNGTGGPPIVGGR